MHPNLPLLEFDDDSPALIDPLPLTTTGEVPEHAVICFFQEVIAEACGEGRADRIGIFKWEHGHHPLYRLHRSGIGARSRRCSQRGNTRRRHFLSLPSSGSGDQRRRRCGHRRVAVLQERGGPHVVGKTWTTDAPYRETRSKIRARRGEGCLTVEMETAAFLAVAQHRAVRLRCGTTDQSHRTARCAFSQWVDRKCDQLSTPG
ncbi:MAG: hypothetical protein ACRDQV_13045 [Pseudonocardiaceae bacterium]